MCAAAGEEVGGRFAQRGFSARVERMTAIDAGKGQRPADETRVGKEQRTKRAATEAGEPAAEDATRFCRENGVGEDDRDIVAVQEHFAHPAAGVRREGEQCFLVGIGAMQGLAQQFQAETAAALQARRQRARLTQPVAQARSRAGRRQAMPPFRGSGHRRSRSLIGPAAVC